MAKIPKTWTIHVDSSGLKSTVDRLVRPVRRLADALSDVDDALRDLQSELATLEQAQAEWDALNEEE